jgi:hypothetical protein
MNTPTTHHHSRSWPILLLATVIGLIAGALGAVGYQLVTDDDWKYEFTSVCETLDIGPYLRLYDPPESRSKHLEPTSGADDESSGECSYNLDDEVGIVGVTVDVDVTDTSDEAAELFEQRHGGYIETSSDGLALTGGARHWDGTFAVVGPLAGQVGYDKNLVIEVRVENNPAGQKDTVDLDRLALSALLSNTMNDVAQKLEP